MITVITARYTPQNQPSALATGDQRGQSLFASKHVAWNYSVMMSDAQKFASADLSRQAD